MHSVSDPWHGPMSPQKRQQRRVEVVEMSGLNMAPQDLHYLS